jgi:hypothetical protein
VFCESGVLFFLVVWNKGLIELHPVKSTQLAFFDAVIAFHINIFPMAYLNCRQLFHPNAQKKQFCMVLQVFVSKQVLERVDWCSKHLGSH